MATEDLNKQLMGRRQFGELCVSLALSLPTVSAMMAAMPNAPAFATDTGPTSNNAGRTVRFADGVIVPALGQGTWHLAQGRHPEAAEEEALRTGLSLGMTVIDTAEIYSDGHSEELVGRVVAGQRDRVFLVSKVHPGHVTGDGIARACEGSLHRLGTDHLDLYLLHWRNRDTDLAGVVAGFERLRATGKIRAWGVSNFKVSDMEDLFRIPDGQHCATNQVLYNLDSRGIEYDLLPWCQQRRMPVMAYSPLAGDSLVHDPVLAKIGAARDCTATAVALAWTIRSGNVIAIPESGSAAHVRENAAGLSLTLTPEELQKMDAAHPVRPADKLRWLLDRGKRWLRAPWL